MSVATGSVGVVARMYHHEKGDWVILLASKHRGLVWLPWRERDLGAAKHQVNM